MTWTQMLVEIFEVCVIPLFSLLTGYLIVFIKQRMDVLIKNSNSELAKKYLEMLKETVTNCVLATNQTYVQALKDKDLFDKAAQKEAFSLTYNAVMNNLTEEAKEYLSHVTNDLPLLITELIESRVALTK